MKNTLQARKKILLRQGLMLGGALLVLGIAAFFLASYDDGLIEKKENAKRESDDFAAKTTVLRNQSTEQLKAISYYAAYGKIYNDNFTLKREKILTLLAQLRAQYHIAHLDINVLPVSEMTGPSVVSLGFKTGMLVKSQVHLAFNAVSDTVVLQFVEAMERQFPGILIVSTLQLSRTERTMPSAKEALTSKELPFMVKAEVVLEWLGLGEKQDNAISPPIRKGAP